MSANKGMRHPAQMVLLFLVLAVASSASVAGGIFMMQTVGETKANGLAIGIGGPVAVISIGMLFLTIRGWRLALALRRGENVIAHWMVSPEDFATFVANNTARNALGADYRNDWKPPKKVPCQGLEVVFGKDIVMVGDRFFGLVNTGMFTFEGVQILPENPLAIEFGTVSTTLSHGGSAARIDVNKGVLRIPIGRLARADAVRVFEHYKGVDAHEIVVNPGFYRGRMRFGLVAAPLCFLATAAGFAMQSNGIGNIDVNLVLMIGGVVSGIGALILAAIAAYLSWQQHRRLT